MWIDLGAWALIAGWNWSAIEAIATVLTVIVALTIWRLDVARARRTDAAQVSVHVAYQGTVMKHAQGHVQGKTDAASLVASNDASAPAYDMVIYRQDGGAEPHRISLLRPGTQHSVGAELDMLRPGQIGNLENEVVFTMNGLRWHVRSDGKPKRVPFSYMPKPYRPVGRRGLLDHVQALRLHARRRAGPPPSPGHSDG